MKITTVNVLKQGDVILKERDTQKAQNVSVILENLSKTQGDLIITGDEMKKYERYAMQKALQAKGAHVVVQSGTHAQTKKPVLVIHRLSDKEWKEYTSK